MTGAPCPPFQPNCRECRTIKRGQPPSESRTAKVDDSHRGPRQGPNAGTVSPRCSPSRPSRLTPSRIFTPGPKSDGTAAESITRTALFARARLVDLKRSAIQISAIHGIDCGLALAVTRHFNKPEPARPVLDTIEDHARRAHSAVLLESAAQILIGCRIRKISHINVHLDALSHPHTCPDVRSIDGKQFGPEAFSRKLPTPGGICTFA